MWQEALEKNSPQRASGDCCQMQQTLSTLCFGLLGNSKEVQGPNDVELTYTYIYIYTHIFVYIYIYIHMYIYIYIYT